VRVRVRVRVRARALHGARVCARPGACDRHMGREGRVETHDPAVRKARVQPLACTYMHMHMHMHMHMCICICMCMCVCVKPGPAWLASAWALLLLHPTYVTPHVHPGCCTPANSGREARDGIQGPRPARRGVADQPSCWRLAEARGSLRHALALREASGEQACWPTPEPP